jgi:hypothetical protein
VFLSSIPQSGQAKVAIWSLLWQAGQVEIAFAIVITSGNTLTYEFYFVNIDFNIIKVYSEMCPVYFEGPIYLRKLSTDLKVLMRSVKTGFEPFRHFVTEKFIHRL